MRFTKLLCDEAGAAAIEYGLIATLIPIACIMAFQMLGLNLTTTFTTVSNSLVWAASPRLRSGRTKNVDSRLRENDD